MGQTFIIIGSLARKYKPISARWHRWPARLLYPNCKPWLGCPSGRSGCRYRTPFSHALSSERGFAGRGLLRAISRRAGSRNYGRRAGTWLESEAEGGRVAASASWLGQGTFTLGACHRPPALGPPPPIVLAPNKTMAGCPLYSADGKGFFPRKTAVGILESLCSRLRIY